MKTSSSKSLGWKMLALPSVVAAGTFVLIGMALPVAAQDNISQTTSPSIEPSAVVEPPVVSPAVVPVPKPEPKTVSKPVAKPVKKGPVDSLRPGQFVWEKRDAYNSALRMVVVLDIQRMYVFDGDELVGFTTISSGKKGKDTPTGVFKILQKKEYHESNIYANAPMPFMQRLTWDGIALHAGNLPGYPASHGCVRLPKVFAKALYGATNMDEEVVILASLDKPKPKPVAPPPLPPVTSPPSVDPVVPPPPPVDQPLPPPPDKK
ncbi:MAG: L,D-transpeptidase family protein [Sphingorhabdus sp.]